MNNSIDQGKDSAGGLTKPARNLPREPTGPNPSNQKGNRNEAHVREESPISKGRARMHNIQIEKENRFREKMIKWGEEQ